MAALIAMHFRRIACYCFLWCLLGPIGFVPISNSYAQGVVWGALFHDTYVNNVYEYPPNWSALGDKLTIRCTIPANNTNVQAPDEWVWVRLRSTEAGIDWDSKTIVYALGQAPLLANHLFDTGNHNHNTTEWTCHDYLFEWGTGNVVGQNRVNYFSVGFEVD